MRANREGSKEGENPVLGKSGLRTTRSTIAVSRNGLCEYYFRTMAPMLAEVVEDMHQLMNYRIFTGSQVPLTVWNGG
jgi:hypothetical protein